MLPPLKCRVLERGWGTKLQPLLVVEESLGPEFLCRENGAPASCWLQRGSHQADNGALNLSSAGEMRTVSLPGYKLSQPDFLPEERFT